MHEAYLFLTGPMVWFSFCVFILGSLGRFIHMAVLAKKKDPTIYAYMSLKYSIRSIVNWIIPFRSTSMRLKPVTTIITYVFHIGLIIMPLFLFSHITMLNEAFNLSWWYLPEYLSDIITFFVICACIFFFVKKFVAEDVKFLTTFSDYLIIIVVALPFITGFWAFHQFPGFRYIELAHFASGELMLIMIPFTKLSHMIFSPFTRGYIGSEFGSVRFAKDW